MTALKNIPTLIGGAAVLAAATVGLTAAIANAVWDIEDYDNCMRKTIRYPLDCCIMSGGQVGSDGQTCQAPPGNAQVNPEPVSGLPPSVITGTQPTVATNAPVSPAPGSRDPGRLPTGGVATP
jgi:hypothetical protein